jgi:flagellar protein FliO/FliZ
MKQRLIVLGWLFAYQPHGWAAQTASMSPTGSIFKMVLGLAAVLMVMALISWAAKRLLPNAATQHSAIKVVGGVSVGSRERVVVLEVANRWLVVGVAQGQVSAIANIDIDANAMAAALQSGNLSTQRTNHAITKPFSAWLKKSADNAKAKRSQ